MTMYEVFFNQESEDGKELLTIYSKPMDMLTADAYAEEMSRKHKRAWMRAIPEVKIVGMRTRCIEFRNGYCMED